MNWQPVCVWVIDGVVFVAFMMWVCRERRRTFLRRREQNPDAAWWELSE